MALTFPLRSQAGGAVAGTLTAAISNGTTTFTSSTALTGWTDVSANNWTGYIVTAHQYGTASEEKILSTYNSGSGVFTIVTRNYDGTAFDTVSSNHALGSTFVLVATATEFAELNALTQAGKSVLLGTGSPGAGGAAIVVGTGTPGAGSSGFLADAGHGHKIPATSLSAWLTAINAAASALVTGSDSSHLLAGSGWIPRPSTFEASGTGVASPVGTSFASGSNTAIFATVTVSGFTKYLVTAVGAMYVVSGGPAIVHVGVGVDSYTVATTSHSVEVASATGADVVCSKTITVGDTGNHVLSLGAYTSTGTVYLQNNYFTVQGIS